MHIKFNKFSKHKEQSGKAQGLGGVEGGQKGRQAADSELKDMHKDSSSNW